MVVLGALTGLGAARTSELAAVMGLDASTVSRHVAKVIERGWASRSSDPNDGRAAVISLTESGRRTREQLWGQWENQIRDITGRWTLQEREEFLELISRVYDGVREPPPN